MPNDPIIRRHTGATSLKGAAGYDAIALLLKGTAALPCDSAPDPRHALVAVGRLATSRSTQTPQLPAAGARPRATARRVRTPAAEDPAT